MDDKNLIRERRLELGLTYEDLGKKVGVGKSTVRKWETGMIENIRRSNIAALAKALDISPSLLMGWDIDAEKPITPAGKNLSKEEETLLYNFNSLNDLGKREANKRVSELTEINKYTYTEEYTLAAHDDGLDEETAKRTLEKAKAIFKQMDEE